MMTPSLSLVLIANGPDRLVVRIGEWLAHQPECGDEVVLFHGLSHETQVRRLLGDASKRVTAFVRGDGLLPGQLRNISVRASSRDWIVLYDGGELIDLPYLAAVRRIAECQKAAFAVTCAPEIQGEEIDMPRVVTGPWALGDTLTIRRTAFEDAGGFDESLPALVEWDLLLTLCGRAQTGLRLPDGLTSRPQDDIRRRERLRPECYLPAVRRILEKHENAFAAHLVESIVDRDRCGVPLWHRGKQVGDLWSQTVSQRAMVESRLESARVELRALGGDETDWRRLRRVTPVSRNWGSERGRPIDRHYIEAFVHGHDGDVRGRVLEMLDDNLARSTGGPNVDVVDVLDIDPGNHRATIISDLRNSDCFPENAYDCFILTQTLHLLDDMPAALRTAWRLLKPGGVLLATMPTVSMVAIEYGPSGDHWRVTPAGARHLFEQVFPGDQLEINAYGNVLAMTAFLHGLSCNEVTPEELDAVDPAFPLIVSVRAVKRIPSSSSVRVSRKPRAAVLLYHRVATPACDEYPLSIAPHLFRSHLEYFAREWNVIPLTELVSMVAAEEVPDRAIALTFDDGYADNLETALPLLEDFGLSATFFLVGESPEIEREFWWDILERTVLRRSTDDETLTLRLDGKTASFPIATVADREALHNQLYLRLKSCGPAVRDDLLRQLSVIGDNPHGDRGRPLNTREIHKLSSHPLATVGAHGVHHRALSGLQDEELHREVFECRTALERLTGRRVDLFAYPFGDISDRGIDMVRASYRAAVTCDPRPLFRGARLHCLPRLEPPPIDGASLPDWLLPIFMKCRA